MEPFLVGMGTKAVWLQTSRYLKKSYRLYIHRYTHIYIGSGQDYGYGAGEIQQGLPARPREEAIHDGVDLLAPVVMRDLSQP